MKKLMIAAAIVCAAALSQAATANWTLNETVTINDGKGESAKAVANGSNVYIFDGGLTTQKAIFDIWAADGILSEAAGYVTTASTDAGKFSVDFAYGEQSVTGASNYYDYFFVVDGGDQIFLSNAKTHNKANTSASPKAINITSGIGDTTSLPVTGGVAGAWNTAAVPEPTSGLLLLLGVAGLALRRRRA